MKDLLCHDRIFTTELPWLMKDDSPAVFPDVKEGETCIGFRNEGDQFPGLAYVVRGNRFHPVMLPKADYTDEQVDHLIVSGFLYMALKKQWKTVRNQEEALAEAEKQFASANLMFSRLITHVDHPTIPRDKAIAIAGPPSFVGTYLEDTSGKQFSFGLHNRHAVLGLCLL